MKDKIYKFLHYAKKYGLRKSVSKTKEYLKKRTSLAVRDIDVMVDVKDVKSADYINRPYKTPPKVRKDKLKIAWVLSAVSEGSGGQNTIVRFARFLKESGHDVTIYIYESIQPQAVGVAKKILNESFGFDVEVKKIADYKNSDVLIATGWETAYPVFNTVTKAHKFYFVQDFEPYFYGLGSKAVLAENTYKMGFYGITAGKWLTSKVSEFGMKADYFDFGADLNVYAPTEKSVKKKKVVFYARPVTERRAFELGIIALDIFHDKHPEYEIEFIGWDVSDYKITFPYKNRGILTHSELATLYQESTACLVLSLTNVSLLPLELLAAGCIPVMNEGENNTMVLGDNRYIQYAPASPIQLANQLSKAVERKDINGFADAAIKSAGGLSWDKSYAKVEEIILREVTKR